MRNHYVKIVVVVFLLMVFLSPVLGAEQILKPTAHTDIEGVTSSPKQAYNDPNSYDESSASSTLGPSEDPTITFSGWDTAGKKDYRSLSLDVTAEASDFGTKFEWGIFYTTTAGAQCELSGTAIKTLDSTNPGKTNFTATLSANQNLADLQVCLRSVGNGNPKQAKITTWDIRTEGTYDTTPPEYRAQQQNVSLISKGETVELSAQAKDNFNLSSAVLSTNETGSFQNKSVYGSPQNFYTKDTWTPSNFTWQNPSLGSSTVSWKIWYNDTSGNYNVTDVKSFVIDAEKPDITVFNPLNKTYSTNNVALEVSASEAISKWKYNLDSAGNTTFTPNTTLTGLSEGSHTVKIWARDSAGNWNSTSSTFSIDTKPPSFSNFKEDPPSPTTFGDKKYQFNVTVSERNLEMVKFEFGSKNYSTSNKGDEYYKELENISAGNYTYRWYANDTLGNSNSTNEIDFEVKKADTNTSLYLNGTRGFQSYEFNSTANLTVGLNVSETVELWTNFSGSLQEIKTGDSPLQDLLELDYQLGSYKIKGVFSGNQNYTSDNETHLLNVLDRTDPRYSSVSDDEAGKIYRNETIQLRTLWEDNYGMSSAILSVNSTGSFQNVSSKETSDWANFSYSFPQDSFPGTFAWRQYGNDTSGNYNRTGDKTQEVWSYASSKANLNTTSVQVGEEVKASCRVKDAFNSDEIDGYPVKLFNETVELNRGKTGSKGWFNTTFSLSEAQNSVPVTCAIGDNTSLGYTALTNGSVDLTVNQGNPPKIYNEIYSLNDTDLYIGESLKAYARWNSSLNYSFVEYDNQSKNNYQKKFKKSPFQNNYTNFTISTGESWFKGRHSAKIYANDSNGNLNNTLERLEFDVNGFSNVNYLGPNSEAERGIVKLRAEVRDANTSEKISDYNVSFWSNGTRLGYNQTNSTGTAVYYWDTSNLEVGEKNISVKINDSDFFSVNKGRDEEKFDLKGLLYPEILELKGIVHRGSNVDVSGRVEDDQGDVVSADTEWLNSSGEVIVNGNSGEWSVPKNYELGEESIVFNASKNLHKTNSTSEVVEVYGYSKISENRFSDSKIEEGESTSYICQISANNTGNPIEDYPVEFYNSTQKIGETLTNSSGYAEKTFNDETAGIESYECRIRDNSSLYFNSSDLSSKERNLETVDTTPPKFNVEFPSKDYEMQKMEKIWINTTWSDNLNLSKAVFSINDSGTFKNQTVNLTGKSDEADLKLENTSFEGILGYKVYANDTYGNFNSTETRQATIYGGSDLYKTELSTSKLSPGNTVNTTCGVRDNVTHEKLSNYEVQFYNGTELLETGFTDQRGEVKFNYSQQNIGEVDLGCKISDDLSRYYRADTNQRFRTVSFEDATSKASLENVNFIGGEISGSTNNLETIDGEYLNWTGISKSGSTNPKVLKVNSSTEIPPETINSVEFNWSLSRSVENTPRNTYDPEGVGTLTYSNGNINSTWYQDTEYAELTEAKNGNFEDLARKGFNVYMPENKSETDFSSIKITAEIKSLNNAGEAVDADIYNYATGNYLDCFEYSSGNYGNVSCKIESNTAISEILNTNELRITFRDSLSQKDEPRSSWRIDSLKVTSEYSNPDVGNTFEYRIGVFNRGKNQLHPLRRINPASNIRSFNTEINAGDTLVAPDGAIQGYISTYVNNTIPGSTPKNQDISVDKLSKKINYELSKTKQITLTTETSDKRTIDGTEFKVFRSGALRDNKTLRDQNFTNQLAKGENYTVRQSIPDRAKKFNVTYRNFSVSRSQDIETNLINYSELDSIGEISNLSEIYAVESSKFDFAKSTLKVPKQGTSPDSIVHCTDYDFSTSQCNEWEVNETSDYASEETAEYLEFNVTSFDAFGIGDGSPLPNITEIRIYDVTDQADKKTGGNLVDRGLDPELNISQKDVNRSYRFEFQVRNDGLQDWNIEASDELFHEGLNSNWSVGGIRYELSQENYTGGTFSSGQVTWNTSNGGILEYEDTNDTMNASYVVNITQEESDKFNQRFEVNDTSEGAGSYHDYILDVKKFGFLNVRLNEPPSNTIVQKNSFFTVNGTVECVEGECGEVSISPRYNESLVADTLIPEADGKPFYTSGTNNVSCNSQGSLNGTCSYTWDVNASGSLNSDHLLDVNTSSSFTEVSGNESRDNTVTINNAIRINVTWESVEFGVLDPGTENNSAQNNSEGYNISIPENSLKVDDLWVRSENMTTDGWKNPSTDESYVIPANNFFYSLNSFVDTKEPLTNNYQNVISDLSSGSSISTYYWMNVPKGIKSSKYNGSIYFKANATN